MWLLLEIYIQKQKKKKVAEPTHNGALYQQNSWTAL